MRHVSGARRIYYGWWILAASVAAMTVVSGLAAWSLGLYVHPLEQEFGWSRAEVSLGFSAGILVSGLAGPAIGRWIDRFGPRSSVIVGSILAALTFQLLAATGSLWQWYLFSAINAAARQMMFFIPFQALTSRWFDRRRGAALSILGVGFSLGGFVVLPLLALVIEATDWRGGFVFSGIISAALVLPLAVFVLRDDPTPEETEAFGEARGRSGESRAAAASLTLGRAIRMPIFWVLSIGLMLFFYGMIGWTVHLVPFFESRDISRETAALLVSLASGAGIVSRLALGTVVDRFQRFETAAVGLISLLACGMGVLLLTGTGISGVLIFLGLWVIGTTAGSMIEALTLTRAFGMGHFATILGAIVVIETMGEILSPSVSGLIFDTTGSYDWALVMYVLTFSGSAVMFAIASRMAYPASPVYARGA
jgi:sugar phosphate permease